jgi:nitrate reductase beta subunit
MVLLVMRIKWNLDSVCLQIVLVLTQYRCTVCDKCTVGSKNIWDTHDGTPR